MKKTAIYLLMFLFSATSFACTPANGDDENTTEQTSVNSESKIEVYYFHYSRRCATCNAVESVTKEALNEYFSKEMKSNKIVFTSVDLDNKDNEALAAKYKISGQTLIFIGATKQVNLTNEGFMYARTSPDKLKVKIQTTVKSLQK